MTLVYCLGFICARGFKTFMYDKVYTHEVKLL